MSNGCFKMASPKPEIDYDEIVYLLEVVGPTQAYQGFLVSLVLQ